MGGVISVVKVNPIENVIWTQQSATNAGTHVCCKPEGIITIYTKVSNLLKISLMDNSL